MDIAAGEQGGTRLIIVRSLDLPRRVYDHCALIDGDTLGAAFEWYVADEHLQLCSHEEAEAEAVFATIFEPTDFDGEAAVIELMTRMEAAASEARVSFGYVRRAA